MPKKKKGGADKEKKAKKKNYLSERDTTFYEQQLLDNNRQLARLRGRNEELENEAEVLKGELRQLEEDRSDVVAHLKRILQQKTEESRELSERLSALEELRKEEQAAFKKREEVMELEYHTMESNLSAEVKLAAGKLNALEDWRLARIDLLQKFEIQEEQMAEQEERHKKMLYEAEKALIIGKAKMKAEMEERLNKLAESFREATNIRIADATHRAVRENIALNKELDAMFKVCRDLEIRTKESKERESTFKVLASLLQNEAKLALNKTVKQARLIEKLAENHFNMTLEYGKLFRAKARLHDQEGIVQMHSEKEGDDERRIKIIEQHVQCTKGEKEEVLQELGTSCEEVNRLSRILQEAARCIAKALRASESHDPSFRENFLRSLLDILGKRDVPSIATGQKSPSRVTNQLEKVDSRYTRGSLGLLPRSTSTIPLKKKFVKKEESETRASHESTTKVESARQSSEGSPKVQEEAKKEEQTLECLLSDVDSLDIDSPVETESPPSSKDSTDTE